MANLEATVGLLNVFGDPTRVRLLSLLAQQELSVAEITTVTQLPQSRVSTHLGKLREAELVRDRRAGASTFYAVNESGMPGDAKKLWSLLATQVDDAVLESDRRRCNKVLEARRAGRWPEAVAGEMERHYSPGRTWEAMARGFAGLVRLGDVLDVGSGDGTVAQMLAPRAKSWVCVDASAQMIGAARARLKEQPNVRCEVASAEALPFPDHHFDDVLLFNVLASVQEPQRVVAEAARVLRRNGSLVVVTLDAHDHLDVAASYGHVHPGFRPSSLRKIVERAGLTVTSCEVTSRERRAPHFSVVTCTASNVHSRITNATKATKG